MSVAPPITAFLQAHASLAGPVSFVIAFLGCLPGINFVVPAGTVITATGS